MALFLACALFFTIFLVPLTAATVDGGQVTRKKQLSGQFLLLTDFHVDSQYDVQDGTVASNCHHIGTTKDAETEKEGDEGDDKKSTGPNLGKYGNPNCDAPTALVDYVLAASARQFPNPDFIVWTGDFASRSKISEEVFLRELELGTQLIKKHFPHTKVIPVLGNHDVIPAYAVTDKRSVMDGIYTKIYDLWTEWIGEEESIGCTNWFFDKLLGCRAKKFKEEFLKGAYYRYTFAGQDFMVLNTNFYYDMNPMLRNKQHMEDFEFESVHDPAGQFAFMRRVLEGMRRTNRKVNILAHVAPGAFVFTQSNKRDTNYASMEAHYNAQLNGLLVKYAPWIRWMVFGHLHIDSVRILRNSNGQPVHQFFVNPPVSPGFRMNNPGYRSYEYDPATFELKDIKTYYVNLEQLNAVGAEHYTPPLEYSMLEAYQPYGLTDINNPQQWDSLAMQMQQNTVLFNEYYRRSRIQYIDDKFDTPDRDLHVCTIRHVDLRKFKVCENVLKEARRQKSANKIAIAKGVAAPAAKK